MFGRYSEGSFLRFLIVTLFMLLIWIILYQGYQEVELNYKRFKITAPMKDIEWKRSIIESSGKKEYRLENLRPLLGPSELTELIKANNENPQIYTPSKNNIEKGVYRANLHMHTTFSDGASSVRTLLDMAQEYAENNLNGEVMYLAITDHNTVLGTQELVRVLQTSPGKYTKIKVTPGIEINTAYNNSKISPRPIDIHVLTLAINPFDKFLNKEFYKKNRHDKYNLVYPHRDFDWLVKTMSDYGIVGVAHPARYTAFLGDDKYAYVKEMFDRFRFATGDKVIFTEGYYQVYPLLPDKKALGKEYDKYLNHINKEAKKRGILLDGSTDVHGVTIFTK